MKKTSKIQKFSAALLSILLLCSCTAQTDISDGDGIKINENSSKKDKIPKIPDTGYRTGNISFDMALADGVRSIKMRVSRSEGVLKAEIKSPDDLAGVRIISDIGGVRLSANDCELGISEEGGAAFKAVFSALELDVSEANISSDGEGGVFYTWNKDQYELMLRVSGEGIPIHIICTMGGMTREGEIENFSIS